MGHQQNFDDITYSQYFSLFRLTKHNYTCSGASFDEQTSIAGSPQMLVVQRDHSRLHLCQLQPACPSEGEIFYLHTILQHRPALSFESVHTVAGEIYPTFQEAAMAMGLFADHNEAELAIQEAIVTLKTPRQLHVLFVHLLVNDCVTSPLTLWNTYSSPMAMDHILQCGNNTDIGITNALHDDPMHLLRPCYTASRRWKSAKWDGSAEGSPGWTVTYNTGGLWWCLYRWNHRVICVGPDYTVVHLMKEPRFYCNAGNGWASEYYHQL